MAATEPLFLVLSPVWNAADWVRRCLDSVRGQTYPHIRHFWVDDASSDGTTGILRREVPLGDLLLNQERRFSAYNVWYALTGCIEEDCLVGLLDGDDWLLDRNAVEQMVAQHARYDVVWSSHLIYEYDSEGLMQRRRENNNPLHRRAGEVRQLSWQPTHFFSFRRKDFLKIKPTDFQTEAGTWFEAMYDMALAVPLIEMAGWERCCYLPKPLYVYNRLRPDNDDKVRRELQRQLEEVIRNRQPYARQR